MQAAFDCFKELHRAQYFYIAAGRYIHGTGKDHPFWKCVPGADRSGNANTLFGDLPCSDGCAVPKIPNCEPWSLTELLDHEKEVTGMFMSGHPLDHFKFEIKHYGITPGRI